MEEDWIETGQGRMKEKRQIAIAERDTQIISEKDKQNEESRNEKEGGEVGIGTIQIIG